jgi:hypothetical protein
VPSDAPWNICAGYGYPTSKEYTMKWNGSSVAMVVAAVFSVGIGAQTGGTMAKDDMTGKMDMKDTTYTGCI